MLLKNKSNIKVKGVYKTSVLRKFQNDILRRHIVGLKNVNNVLNVGALPTDGDKEGGLYSDLFSGKEYYTLDMHSSFNSNYHLNYDLHDLSKLDLKFDLILVMSVLEHVKNPFIVVNNLCSLMNLSGYIFICTPFFYPIHKDSQGKFSDYWRFTDDAIRILFKGLKEIFIKEAPSVIKQVADRPTYWDNKTTSVSGYCALFQEVNEL